MRELLEFRLREYTYDTALIGDDDITRSAVHNWERVEGVTRSKYLQRLRDTSDPQDMDFAITPMRHSRSGPWDYNDYMARLK